MDRPEQANSFPVFGDKETSELLHLPGIGFTYSLSIATRMGLMNK